jgi:hypothetical protein
MKISDAEKQGRLAFALDEDKRRQFKNELMQEKEAMTNSRKRQIELIGRSKLMREREIQAQIAANGNVSEQVARSNMFRGFWLALFLILPVTGELVFTKSAVQPFNLGILMTTVIAATIIYLSLKGMDLYLSCIRRNAKNFETVVLVIACISLISLFALLFFSVAIRENFYQLNALTGLDTSPENTVKRAEEFYQNNGGSFGWLMLTLAMASIFLGGLSYHLAKNLISGSIPLLGDYKKLRKLRDEMLRASQELCELDSQLARFSAEFDAGLMKAQIENERKTNGKRKFVNQSRLQAMAASLGRILISPITLIIMALILFLTLKGVSFGAEYVMLFDISRSEEVKYYSGKITAFEKNKEAGGHFIKHQLVPGDYLQVFGITEDSFSRPYGILECNISKNKGALGEVTAREKIALAKKWNQLDLKATAKATDLFGAIHLAALSFSSIAKDRHLIIYSDMRQCAHSIDIERPKIVDADAVLKRVEQLGLIPQLKAVKVSCLGVHSAGKSPAYWLSLKKFWEGYFQKAQANLITFSMERRIHNE